MESYYAAVRRFLRARLRGNDWVEDLVQETFARAFAAHAVRPVSAPHAFLLRTASNLLVDFHRREQSRTLRPRAATLIQHGNEIHKNYFGKMLNWYGFPVNPVVE